MRLLVATDGGIGAPSLALAEAIAGARDLTASGVARGAEAGEDVPASGTAQAARGR